MIMIEKILSKVEELTAFSHPFINEKLVCKNDVLAIVQEVAKDGGWIPCSGCSDCQHKECKHYGKV